MRIYRYLSVTLSCLILSLSSAYSQLYSGACLPDCLDQPFGPIIIPYAYITLPGCPSCVVEVRYRTRIACPPQNYQDLFIERISGNNIYTCVSSCFGGSLSNFIKAVSEQMLIANPMGFLPLPPPPPPDPPCADNWRVMKGSCWTMESTPGVPGINPEGLQVAHPCSEWLCCLEKYTVCIVNNQRVVTQTLYMPPSEPMCPDDGHPYNAQNCVYVCGSVYRP